MTRPTLAYRLLAGVFFSASLAQAEPTIRVRGEVRIEAAAARTERRLVVAGTVVDDTGRPVPNAHIGLVGVSDAGKVVGLPPAEPCPGPAPSEVRKQTGNEVRLDGDRLGRFCAALSDETSVSIQINFEDPRGLLDAVSRTVSVDASRRAVELRFVSAAPALDLERESHRLEVAARTPSPFVETSALLPLALHAHGARGDELVAQGSCALGATALLEVSSARLGGPGPIELALRFSGTESLQPAETRVRLLATTRVRLALSRPPEGTDPTDGIGLDIAVGSRGGAVAGGSVEAMLKGQSVGIAPVERGSAHVVARFPRQGPTAPLELRYLPNEPWWVPGEPLKVTLPVSARSHWSSLGWFALFALLALWLVYGWRRPPRTIRPDAHADGRRPAPAAAVVVVERDESLHGWQGVVRDAHDETPVAGAVVTLMSGGSDSRVLSRATADAEGRFELAAAPGGEVSFLVSAGWHADLVCPAPPHGRLRIDLVSRRRHLLARLVRWAERRGPLGRGVGEPTPADVVAQARKTQRADVAEWAGAVEAAAFGPTPVDDGVEREVTRKEPPDPGGTSDREPLKRAH